MLILVGLGPGVGVVSAVAGRFGMLSPILLGVAGVALSFIPGVPEIRLQPEVVLIGILPPLLYVAAVETSVPAFRYNLRPILLLAVGLVVFTAACVGFVVHALLPKVPLAACLALGAVVAPPDAVAATAVARRIGLPRRIVTILEGESLINDATALVLLRVSVAAAVGSAVGAGQIALDTVLAAGGGVTIGGARALLLGFLHPPPTDPPPGNPLAVAAPLASAPAAEIPPAP